MTTPAPVEAEAPLLEARGLTKVYQVRRGLLQRLQGVTHALAGVDLTLRRGECFALVGESGSGKTTLGRCLVRLLQPSSGQVWFEGEDLTALRGEALRRRRRGFQMVFQDPYGSLNPRLRIGAMLREVLDVHRIGTRAERPERVAELLRQVGLDPDAAGRFPHEFSGGQRQRIGIARALATEPRLLVADEPVSALDVSVRAQIINLLSELQQRLGLTVLLIAHDLAVVEQVADRVAVMYRGRIVEQAATAELFRQPRHPYTRSLLAAVPVPDPSRPRRRAPLQEEAPDESTWQRVGCNFAPRCPIARPRCSEDDPRLAPMEDEAANPAANAPAHRVACYYPELEPSEAEPAMASDSA